MASPTPKAPENDLDQALEAIFDAPSTPPPLPTHNPEAATPSTPPPTSIPQTPEPSPKKPRQKSILEHLIDNEKRLSASAAKLAHDVTKLAEAKKDDENSSNTGKLGDGEAEKKRHTKEIDIKERLAAKRRREKKQPTKNAFAVIGRDNRPDGAVNKIQTYQYVDRVITNMSLTEVPYEQSRLEAIFEHTPRLDIADIKSRYEEIRIGAFNDYTVFGCLVKKIMKKSAKNGNMYAVWSLCNMPRGKFRGKDVESTVVRLLVFDDAYETFHTRCEGTVFALRKPALLPRRDGIDEKLSQHAMRISRKDNVVVLGVCKDFKLCEVRKPGGELCGNWYDANRNTSCHPHFVKRKKACTTGTRMDIQNALRPNTRDSTKGLRPPMDISAMGIRDDDIEATQFGNLDRKRKLDSQLANDIKRKHRKRTKTSPGTFLNSDNTPDGMKKRPAPPDPMASTRGKPLVRDQRGERHARLLGRSDRQIRYHEACEILHGLGFKLLADGGWDPPERCLVTLVTTGTHRFSGLGKVQRRRGRELGALKRGNGAIADGKRNQPVTCEDDKQESGESKDVGEIEQGEEEGKMEVDSGNARNEAQKDSPVVPSTLGEETESKDEASKMGKEDTTADDKKNKSSLHAPSKSPELTKPEGERMEMNDGQAGNGATKDAPDVQQESSEDTRATPSATENEEDIVLSDESEEE